MFRFFIFLLFVPVSGFTQKRALTISDYDGWNSIKLRRISNDGNWISYITGPEVGVDTLFIETFTGGKRKVFANCNDPEFSYDSKYLLFTKVGRNDTCFILNLFTDSLTRLTGMDRVEFPDLSGNVYASLQKLDENSKKEDRKLFLTDLVNNRTKTFTGISDFTFSKQGDKLLMKQYAADNKVKLLLHNITTAKSIELSSPFSRIEKACFDTAGKQVSFLADTTGKGSFSIWLVGAAGKAELLDIQVQRGFEVTDFSRLYFNRAGTRLHYTIQPSVYKKEVQQGKANVEIWNYNDSILYTQKILDLNQRHRKRYACVYLVGDKRSVQLMQEEDDDIQLAENDRAEHALVITRRYGLKESQQHDAIAGTAFLVSLKDGGRKLIHDREAIYSYQQYKANKTYLSPGGKYVIWYHTKQGKYYSYEIATGKKSVISNGITEALTDQEEGVLPRSNSPRSIAFWTLNDNEVYVHGNKDIWILDPSGNKPARSFTNGLGVKNNLRFNYEAIYSEEPALSPNEPVLMGVFDYKTKDWGWYQKRVNVPDVPIKLEMNAYTYRYPGVAKALFANRFVLSRGNPASYELYKTENFKTFTPITDLKRQQQQINWYTSKLVKYKTVDGVPAEGVLLKPENFDPNKKYPLLIFFYEDETRDLNAYRKPELSYSIIDFAYYTSKGYMVFIPAIKYKVGYPGQSVVNTVIGGINYLKRLGYIDSAKIGLQGHSWSAYQQLYLLTQTHLFKAASLGATVSNMISAYASLRGSTGNSRQWIYEDSQSRIGKSLWEAPDYYIKNSPVFQLHKVNTPILLMHNDQDNSVPFSQGFELFSNLYRLHKPVWLLNYPGEQHIIRSKENKLDFTIRMQQFFDHYLKGSEAPSWLGVNR